MWPTSAGVEPATSWSPVGRRIQLSHRGRQMGFYIYIYKNKISWAVYGFDMNSYRVGRVYLRVQYSKTGFTGGVHYFSYFLQT